MKSIFLLSLAGVFVLLGAGNRAFAQTNAAPAPASTSEAATPEAQPSAMELTPAEKAQIKKAQKAALDADPDLKAEDETLKKQHQDAKTNHTVMTTSEKKSQHATAKAHLEKLKAAMLKIDPTLGPVLAKEDVIKKNKHHMAKSTGAN